MTQEMEQVGMQILPVLKSMCNKSWDCDITIGCYDPGDGTDWYADFNDCESQCILASWDYDTTTAVVAIQEMEQSVYRY